MPFIEIKTNAKINQTQEAKLKELIENAMRSSLGIGKEYLLIGFQDNSKLYLGGENEIKIGYIKIGVFNSQRYSGFDRLCDRICAAFYEILEISPRNLYIKFEDIAAFLAGAEYIRR